MDAETSIRAGVSPHSGNEAWTKISVAGKRDDRILFGKRGVKPVGESGQYEQHVPFADCSRALRRFSRRMFPRILLPALALFVAPLFSLGSEKWDPAIKKFTDADAKTPPPKHAVVFVGSSSIVKWTSLAEDFPGVKVVNRGFGGSQLADSVEYVDRIVIPYEPRVVVLYAGDNDIKAGKTPEAVPSRFSSR